MDHHEINGLRLAPWETAAGRPCYLSTAPEGVLTVLADAVEADQLTDAREVLQHARSAIREAGRPLTAPEALWIVTRLAESLGTVLRVADSRGMRLGDDS